MKVYHNTPHSEAILAEGFRDATDFYLTNTLHTGVWVSDTPLDENEGADGDVMLCLEMPEELLLPYEWIEPKGYREFLVPADLLNSWGPPVIVPEPNTLYCLARTRDGNACPEEAVNLRLEDVWQRRCSAHAGNQGLVFDEERAIWREAKE